MATTREIARELGLSHVTVAAALRGTSKCSEETRQRVLQAARRLGWRPNPLVMAFQEAVAAGRSRKPREGIAWITEGAGVRSLFQVETCLRAARERAAYLGFWLNEFTLADYGFGRGTAAETALAAVLRVVHATGIRAVVLPIREHLSLLKLSGGVWSDLSVVLLLDEGEPVKAGTPNEQRELFHRVTTDVYANTQAAMRELFALGYRRVGLCLSEWRNRSTLGAIVGAYQTLQLGVERAEPFLVDAPPPSRPPAGFLQWIRKGSFDAILCGNTEIKSWLEISGYSVPGHMGLAHFELGPAEHGWSGIDPRLTAIASSAVDLLTSHLLRRESGVPEFTKVLRVEGVWVGGSTTAAQDRSTPRSSKTSGRACVKR